MADIGGVPQNQQVNNAVEYIEQQVQNNPFADSSLQAIESSVFEEAIDNYWESDDYQNAQNKEDSSVFASYLTKQLAQKAGISADSKKFGELLGQITTWSQYIAKADGKQDLTQDDFYNEEYYLNAENGSTDTVSGQAEEEYTEYAKQLYDSMARFGTDEESFYEVLNNSELDGNDWTNIIKTYEQEYGVDLISIINSDFSGPNENAERNQIMSDIASKLTSAAGEGDEEALDTICEVLFNSLGGNIPEGIRKGSANEFAQNIILNSSDKVNAMILSKYSEITGSDLTYDIERCADVSKANKDLMKNKINLASQYNLSEESQTSSVLSELNLDNYPLEDQNKARTINILVESLNSETQNLQNQNNEDGAITNDFNIVKSLIGIGVSSEDVTEALAMQQEDILRLTKALNGESDESFEDAFKDITGVEFNEEKMIEYQENAALYEMVTGAVGQAQYWQDMALDSDNLQDVLNAYTGYFANQDAAVEELNKMLSQKYENIDDYADPYTSYISGIQVVKNSETGEYEAVISRSKYAESKDENGKAVRSIVDSNQQTISLSDCENVLSYDDGSETNLVDDAKSKMNMFLGNLEGYDSENIEGNIEKLAQNYANSKLEAIGTDRLENVVNEYCKSQNGFIDKLASITQITGMATMAVGAGVSFVAPPAGIAMMTAGKYMALGGMFGDNVLELADNLSSTNGLTQQEFKDTMKETAAEVGYLLLGAKINSVAQLNQINSLEALKTLGLSDKSAKVLSWLIEGGTDMGLSVLSDMIITGDMNIDRNTMQVLMGILTGVSSAKVSAMKSKLQASEMDKILKGETNVDDSIKVLQEQKFTSKEIEQFKENLSSKAQDMLYSSSGETTGKLTEAQTGDGTAAKVKTQSADTQAQKGMTSEIEKAMLDAGFDEATIAGFKYSQFPQDKLLTALEFTKAGFSVDTAKCLTFSGNVDIGKVNTLLENGFDVAKIESLSQISDFRFNPDTYTSLAIEYKNQGMSADAIVEKLTTMRENEFKEFGLSADDAEYFASCSYATQLVAGAKTMLDLGTDIRNVRDLLINISSDPTAAGFDTYASLASKLLAQGITPEKTGDFLYKFDKILGSPESERPQCICEFKESYLREAGVLKIQDEPMASEFNARAEKIKSDQYMQKVDKLFNAVMSDTAEETYCPTFASDAEALGKLNAGDVFQVEGDEFISIKTPNGMVEKLHITKDTYFKLFNPADDLMISQGTNGDCYFLSGVDAYYNDPVTRASVLRSFEELEGGVINVYLSAKDGSILTNTYDSTDITPFLHADNTVAIGPRGLQMLEDAQGFTRMAEEFNNSQRYIGDMAQFISKPDALPPDEAKAVMESIDAAKEKIQNHTDNPVESATKLREGGVVNEVALRFGLGSKYYGEASIKNIADWIKQTDENTWKHFIFNAGTTGTDDTYIIDSETGLVGGHAYQLFPFKADNGDVMLKVINPHDTRYETTISLDKLEQLFKGFYLTAKD